MELTTEEKRIIKEKREKEGKTKKILSWEPRPLSDFSDEEKIKFFDQTYRGAVDDFEFMKENDGEPRKDTQHYAWEDTMSLLDNDGESVWTILRKFRELQS